MSRSILSISHPLVILEAWEEGEGRWTDAGGDWGSWKGGVVVVNGS